MKEYSELEAENAWLKGCLRESRREKGFTDRINYMLAMLFAVSTILLVLTWSGVIVV